MEQLMKSREKMNAKRAMLRYDMVKDLVIAAFVFALAVILFVKRDLLGGDVVAVIMLFVFGVVLLLDAACLKVADKRCEDIQRLRYEFHLY